jgi:hypothetical protein
MIYILTFESYNKPRSGAKRRWSVRYKKSIDCNNPKGFSQKQYCKRKKRKGHYKTESFHYEHSREIIENLSDLTIELSDRDFTV